MQTTSEDKTPQRVPRPKGATIKSMEGKNPELYNIVSEAFVRGLFPFGGTALSIYEFASQYNIPVKYVEGRIKDGFASHLIEDKGNLAEALEKERLRLFSSNLFRIGNSDRVINQLLVYLSGRVFGSPTAHPLLIKEINTTLGTQVRLTETSLKAITMLSEALSTVAVDGSDLSAEEQLTREEILTELSAMKEDPEVLRKHLEGAPSLDPIDAGDRPRERLKEGSHSYNKKPETREIPMPADIPILAK